MTRNELFDEMAKKGATIPDAAYLTDQQAEDGYSAWRVAGSPEGARIMVEHVGKGEWSIRVVTS